MAELNDLMSALLTSLWLVAAITIKPVSPPSPQFVSSVHGLTFKAPRDAWICPLPNDWTGSDHGTVIFLKRPTSCEGTGYASIGRNISDQTLVPQIDVYYGYVIDDEPLKPCTSIRSIEMFGKQTPLCREAVDGGAQISATGRFFFDEQSEAVVTLVTTEARLARDLPVFRTLTASMRACRATWTMKGHSEVIGTGPKCPKNGQFF